MIGLDTNVVVRYLTQDHPEQAARASAIVDGLTVETPGFIATVVWAEIHWVLTRAYRFSPSDVVERLDTLALADEIRAENVSAVRTAIVAARRGADFADALIDAAAGGAGCGETVTFDQRAAAKLGWRLV